MNVQDRNVENRSEILFLYDARDCNPNGNPVGPENNPRIDTQTRECIVTDVRLKRYLRDQMDEDGHQIYIRKNITEQGSFFEREDLFLDIFEDEIKETLRELDEEDLRSNVLREFLTRAVDVRMFGGTMSLEGDDELVSSIPKKIQGPIQFSPGRSLNKVVMNHNYDSLTSVVATKEDKEQGGYDLDDKRIKYGLIMFHGIINENSADTSLLSKEDVRRLDCLSWRAIKNQTITRSKTGQDPKLYIRVEYEEDNYQIGDLDLLVNIDEESSEDHSEMRNIKDVTLDVDELVDILKKERDRINEVRIKESPHLEYSLDTDSLTEKLEDVGLNVDNVNVSEEYKNYMPSSEGD